MNTTPQPTGSIDATLQCSTAIHAPQRSSGRGRFSFLTPARSWLTCFLACFLAVEFLLIASLLTPAPYGDLTRLGLLSDRQFGWTKSPPVVAAEHAKSWPLEEADILVVGDSFSMTLRWQSELIKSGYKISTIYWGQSGPLCADFSKWVRQAGFKGDLVIVESVERLLGDRLFEGRYCESMPGTPVVKLEPFVEPLAKRPSFALNWEAPLSTGLRVFKSGRRAAGSSDTLLHNRTWVRRVAEGCTKFSHRLCDRALFFIDDVTNPPLDAASAGMISEFNASQPELEFIWMVIPDKTTVYAEPDRAASFVEQFKRTGLGPDLFEFAAHGAETVDFYLGNDTHMSMQGQLDLGRHILKTVQGRARPGAPRNAEVPSRS